MKTALFNKYLDIAGFVASMLCAIHCALTPVVLAFSALGGLAFLANPNIESTAIAVSSVVALLSLLPSYKKHHQILPIFLAATGFALIASGHLFEGIAHVGWFEPVTVATGGTLVAFAHVKNWLLTRPLQITP